MSVDFSTLIWIFLALMALQPLLTGRWFAFHRLKAIQSIEKARGSRVITMIHRQEKRSLFGFNVARHIDLEDAQTIIAAIKETPAERPIDLILHTPGGLVLAAMQIARAVEAHPGKVTVFVPVYAMSGGTLIALAADEIVMSRHAVLGPVDPQLGQLPAASLIKVTEQKPIGRIDDETLVKADVGRKAIAQLKQAARELLNRRLPAQQAEELAEKLSTGTWTHDYPISADAAKELGLAINTDIPNDMMELMTLYPQPTRMQGGGGGVEYLPVPRQREAERSAP